jgi:mono/diheme cytochrome c family protein
VVASHLEASIVSQGACVILRLGAALFLVSSAAAAQNSPPEPRQRGLSPFSAAKARALMRDRLPCTGCHVLDGEGGRIGPDLSAVADRRLPDYVRRMIEDPQRTVPGTIMPRVPMASSTRELIITYLTRGAAAPAAAASSSDRQPHEDARDGSRGAPELYARYCAACHGGRGGGDGANARYLPVRPAPHADPSYMSRRSDDRLFDAIYSGGYPLGRSATMPAFGETLSRSEVWSLVRHLRALCRCAGPAWSTDGDRSQSDRPDSVRRPR